MGGRSTSSILNMRFLLSATLILTFSSLSYQFYAPPLLQRLGASSSQQNCRQVPKEVCSQVPKTTFESVTRQQCRTVPDTVLLTSRSVSVRSPKGLSNRLCLARSATLSSEASARLPKIRAPSVVLFKMKNATTFLSSNASMLLELSRKPSMKRNALLSTIRFVQPGLRKSVPLELRPSVRLYLSGHVTGSKKRVAWMASP